MGAIEGERVQIEQVESAASEIGKASCREVVAWEDRESKRGCWPNHVGILFFLPGFLRAGGPAFLLCGKEQ